MKKIIKIQVLLILISIILIPFVDAVSLGSFARKDSATLNPGEKTTFKILFWNFGDPYYLKISENIPKDWKVSIKPNNFLLETTETAKPPFDKADYINLPGVGIIKPYPVEIEIEVPKGAKTGEYTLNFVATASSIDKKISTSQERDINFKVNVINGDSSKEESQNQQIEPKITVIEDKKTSQQNNETNENLPTGRIISSVLKNQILIIILSLVGILLISLVIYKHA